METEWYQVRFLQVLSVSYNPQVKQENNKNIKKGVNLSTLRKISNYPKRQ